MYERKRVENAVNRQTMNDCRRWQFKYLIDMNNQELASVYEIKQIMKYD